jgi:hypothetical protein
MRGMKKEDEDSSGATRIEIDGRLYEKLRAKAKELGYSSTDEFIIRVLEEVVGEVGSEPAGSQEAEEAVRKRLRSLGYLG